MFKNAVVALKDGVDHQVLMALATAAVQVPATLHLATLIRVGIDEDELERRKSAEQVLENHAEVLLREQGYEVTTHVGFTAIAPATDILKLAGERNADLIVIGLAKRSRVGKALLGSDAQRVLLGASCPVLTAHAGKN